jgi:hypothetical protein
MRNWAENAAATCLKRPQIRTPANKTFAAKTFQFKQCIASRILYLYASSCAKNKILCVFPWGVDFFSDPQLCPACVLCISGLNFTFAEWSATSNSSLVCAGFHGNSPSISSLRCINRGVGGGLTRRCQCILKRSRRVYLKMQYHFQSNMHVIGKL